MVKTQIPVIDTKRLEQKALELYSNPTLLSLSSILKPEGSFYRELKPKIVKKICDNFNPNIFLPVIVSKRDDGYYLIDGGYRIAAATKLSFTHILCYMFAFDSEGVAHEAGLFGNVK